MTIPHKQLCPLLLSVCLTALLTSCDKSTVYHSFQHIPNNAWNARDTVSFSIDTIPNNGIYAFTIELRTNTSYPYQSIWLAINRETHNPPSHLCDTVECLLTNNQAPHIKQGIHVLTHSTPLTPLHLYKGQTAHVRISHLMRHETTQGICDVGLLVRHK